VAQRSSGQVEKLEEEKRSLMVTAEPKVFKAGRKQRQGKGFSREEIRKADSSPAQALRLGVRVDSKRKTVHEENVEALKAYFADKKAAAKPEIVAKPKIAAKPKKAIKPGRKTKS
jgi:ribosomal protein L13E